MAHVSYLESTRAKAQLNRDQADQFYTGNLANFAPGLTHTFDADVFVATLRSLRPVGSAGAVPLFDRSQDQTVPAGRTVADSVGILVVEGNYLLLASQPWQQVASLLDATVALRPSLGTLEQRLMKRWRAHGLSPQMAYGKTHGNDLNNAKRVLNESADATLTLHQLH
ncbi:hypothetical protein ROE7235_00982 [Roseibaca ekhonensis]|uniref:Pantothenate kinase n=1 Tax=Roseinatronobacter ekhonensis TaxID=254356 RepID=A0A3B0MTK6_9RHOB|nr:hypothetical protein ROE7235_00982 [Roseibaca ekhonensis]